MVTQRHLHSVLQISDVFIFYFFFFSTSVFTSDLTCHIPCRYLILLFCILCIRLRGGGPFIPYIWLVTYSTLQISDLRILCIRLRGGGPLIPYQYIWLVTYPADIWLFVYFVSDWEGEVPLHLRSGCLYTLQISNILSTLYCIRLRLGGPSAPQIWQWRGWGRMGLPPFS